MMAGSRMNINIDEDDDRYFVFDFPGGAGNVRDSPESMSYVKLGGVTGLQIGNGNAMSIATGWGRQSFGRKKKYPKTPPPKNASKIHREVYGGLTTAFATASVEGASAVATSANVGTSTIMKQKIRTDNEKTKEVASEGNGDEKDVKEPVEQDVSEIENMLDDLKICGTPVNSDKPPAIGTARPFRFGRDGSRDAIIDGAGRTIRCYCHGMPGRNRFCAHLDDHEADVLWTDRMDRVKRCADDVSRSGPVPLFNAIMTGARKIVEDDPHADLELGKFYVQTAYRRASIPLSDIYRNYDHLRPAVQAFFKKHGTLIDSISDRIVDRVGHALGRGLYSTVVMMDRCANTIQGREERPIAVLVRTAAAIAVELDRSEGNLCRLLSAHPKDDISSFDVVLSAMASYAVVLSARVMAYAGLRGQNPLFDAVAYRPVCGSTEGTFNGSLCDVCDLVTNGISVSVSLSDLGGDCTLILHHLGIHCKSLREIMRFRVTVRVYIDLWSMDSVYAFAFILGPGREYSELTYAFNVPQIFWDRYLDDSGDKHWHAFFRQECSTLNRVDASTFKVVYERMENEAAGMGLSPWWVISSLDACVALGNTAVVYPHNLKPVITGDIGRTMMSGPGVNSMCDSFVGVSPIHNVCINLENCMFDGEGAENPDDVFVGSGCRFSFLALRSLVKDAVIIANAILDMTVRDNAYGAGDHICLYRALHISAIGLHNVVNKLGHRFCDEAAFTFNRRVSEVIYYSAVRASVDLCMAGCPPFPKFSKSLYASGRFYPDLYDEDDRGSSTLPAGSWEKLREDVMKHGIRNSAFICGGLCEEGSDFAGTSCGVWPRSGNISFEESPLYAAPNKEQFLREALESAETLRLDVAAVGDDKKLMCLVKSKRVKLPVVNKHLLSLPRHRASMAMRMGYAAGWYADSDCDTGIACLETGWTVSPDAMIKMCVERQPFMDQGQSLPIFIGPGRSSVELARHLRRANCLSFGVGIYKCRVSQSVNYR
uniref:Ribonucleotide reductase subunit 1 n=1 Tax=Mastomys natalensis cytomegalovirus 1 TaxID=2973541 RepID=A0A9Y1IL24_9BETA|nr:ribonucleotide reductase subunit 1 [Mastomys natalensis cytomegalovirus 1]WEG71140.1 ribonucleotide reductase subunit 1 [Mastomys natalensis cytomegalovirus 1]